jgi:L-rhamnose-H+ transport protein
VSATEAVAGWDANELVDSVSDARVGSHGAAAPARLEEPAPLAVNYLFSALAGVTWYLQFFFYSMGETQMGAYGFSSWTLHMASIIIFSTLWGIALREWQGTGRRTHLLIALGLAALVGSTLVVGYGNFIKLGAPAS